MALNISRARNITEGDLRDLINAQVPEGKSIDYKADLPGNADASKRDYLADLCSFANVIGGHIVYGREEQGGLPTALPGLSVDIDQAILRLENMARDGIRPAIAGLEFVRVPLAAGNGAIVVVIPKSWNPPHQVIFQKDYRFYSRGSAGKQHFDVDELRRIVLFSQEIGERVRQFRASRVGAVMNDDTPVALQAGAHQILHFVPLGGFAAGAAADLSPIYATPARLSDMIDGVGSVRHNVDGLLAHREIGQANLSYAQLFRNGVIETVSVWDGSRTGTKLPSLAFERDIFTKSTAALKLLDLIAVAPPVVMLLSFTGMKGWEMAVRDTWGVRGSAGGFDRDPLLIPELVVEPLGTDDVRKLVRPVIESTWQAAGYAKSDYYNQQGEWVGEGN